ncbi:MAG: hypothetical protein A3J42_07590 [Candidatus Dadabacteria bacterium RIFCSPHIGHO2_12_FULL_53_21]|nr:MAG: hypothetical protein A3J42_07590 [Candidatus Dadabacteria bacterium RIFCSPHIGHO2_12_FULL_53_21]
MSLLKLGKDNWVRTRPTKEGLTFIALSLFVGFAAINTGNNLLYLTFGIMMSFVAASGFLSMINLSGIEVKILSQGDVFALTPATLRFSLINGKAVIPSYSLNLEIDEKTAFIPYLPPKAGSGASLKHVFRERGWNKIPEARLSTRFPFGFFKKWIKIDLGDDEVLVFPKIDPIDPGDEIFKEGPGEAESEKTGFGFDLRSIKEFRQGDNPRLIHWKMTAKTGRLMVREMEDEEIRGAVIEFHPERDKTRLEHQISRLASLFVELLKRGFEVELKTPDMTFSSSRTGRSPRPVLRYLALFRAEERIRA